MVYACQNAYMTFSCKPTSFSFSNSLSLKKPFRRRKMAACSMQLAVPAVGRTHTVSFSDRSMRHGQTIRNPMSVAAPRRRPLNLRTLAFKGPEVKRIEDWKVQKVSFMPLALISSSSGGGWRHGPLSAWPNPAPLGHLVPLGCCR